MPQEKWYTFLSLDFNLWWSSYNNKQKSMNQESETNSFRQLMKSMNVACPSHSKDFMNIQSSLTLHGRRLRPLTIYKKAQVKYFIIRCSRIVMCYKCSLVRPSVWLQKAWSIQDKSLTMWKNISIKSKAITPQLVWFSEDWSHCTSIWKSQHDVLSSVDLIDPLLKLYRKSILIFILNEEPGTQNYTYSRSNS